MKVKELINMLSEFSPDDDIELSHKDGRDTITCKNIRTYRYDPKGEKPNTVTIDGY